MKEKKCVTSLSCGHALVMDKRDAAASANGNHARCGKCPANAPERRIVERRWVHAGKEGI